MHEPTRRAWQRITTWLAAHAAPMHATLVSPAGEDARATLETKLGGALPESLRTLLALCDGGDRMWSGADLLGIAGIARAARLVRTDAEAASWIPFVDLFSSGDYLCLDAGGRVMRFNHDDAHAGPLAPSLLALLQQIAEDLEAGMYGYDADEDDLMPASAGRAFALSTLPGRARTLILTKQAPTASAPHTGKVTFYKVESSLPAARDEEDDAEVVFLIDGKLLAKRKGTARESVGARLVSGNADRYFVTFFRE